MPSSSPAPTGRLVIIALLGVAFGTVGVAGTFPGWIDSFAGFDFNRVKALRRSGEWTGPGCIAIPEERADWCEVLVGGGSAPNEEHRLKCGEEATFCGRSYRCLCQACLPWPDYYTRMRRERKVSGYPTHIYVDYADGRCEVMLSFRADGPPDDRGDPLTCNVLALDESLVGGCKRRNYNEHLLACGESLDACDGMMLRCECPDGGDRFVSVDGEQLDRRSLPAPPPGSLY